MKIYVLSKGEYSGRRVVCATIDKQKADRFVKLHDADLEEFDDEAIEIMISQDYKYYDFTWRDNGVVVNEIEKDDVASAPNACYISLYRDKENGRICGYGTVMARNQEEAIKIASDKFAQKKAKLYGIST